MNCLKKQKSKVKHVLFPLRKWSMNGPIISVETKGQFLIKLYDCLSTFSWKDAIRLISVLSDHQFCADHLYITAIIFLLFETVHLQSVYKRIFGQPKIWTL